MWGGAIEVAAKILGLGAHTLQIMAIIPLVRRWSRTEHWLSLRAWRGGNVPGRHLKDSRSLRRRRLLLPRRYYLPALPQDNARNWPSSLLGPNKHQSIDLLNAQVYDQRRQSCFQYEIPLQKWAVLIAYYCPVQLPITTPTRHPRSVPRPSNHTHTVWARVQSTGHIVWCSAQIPSRATQWGLRLA